MTLSRAYAYIIIACVIWIAVMAYLTLAIIQAAQPVPPEVVVIEQAREKPEVVEAQTVASVDVREQTFHVTAYSLDDPGMRASDHPDYGVTASGVYVQEGVTVACGPAYPFGAVFVIEGIGARVCQDRGSAIDNGDLDLYISDREAALRFGVQELPAVVVRTEEQ